MILRVLLLDDNLREARDALYSALAPFLDDDSSFAKSIREDASSGPVYQLRLEGMFDEPVLLELRHNPTDHVTCKRVAAWLNQNIIGGALSFDLVLLDDQWGGGEDEYAGQRRLLPILFDGLSPKTMFCLFTQHWEEPDRTGNLASLLLQNPYRGSGRLFGLSKYDKGGIVLLVSAILGQEVMRERARVQGADVESPLPQTDHFGAILGHSVPMREIYRFIEKASLSDQPVLIRGESGTGKGLVAKAIHDASRRAEGPFVHVPCAGLPETLLESELFGYEKGAFTGASAMKKGRFELAQGGTIFLDEVGDFSGAVQVKLLRVLEEGTFERLGGIQTIHSQARVVAATHRDLDELMAEGDFRSDLFYRLNVLPCFIPPLRERPEDIPLLIPHFVTSAAKNEQKTVTGVSEPVRSALLQYPWQGNVRELRNCIHNMVVMTDNTVLDAGDFANWMARQSTNKRSNDPKPPDLVTTIEVSWVEPWMEQLDARKLKNICQEILRTGGECIAHDPDTIVDLHGLYYLRAVLSAFYVALSEDLARFDAIFGFLRPPKRKTVKVGKYVQDRSKTHPEIFPKSTDNYYTTRDLKRDGVDLRRSGFIINLDQ